MKSANAVPKEYEIIVTWKLVFKISVGSDLFDYSGLLKKTPTAPAFK